MKKFFYLLSFIAIFLLSSLHAFSQAKDGEASVLVGNSVTVSIGSPYQTTLSKATGISYNWTAGSSIISIQSKTNKTCTITGNSVGATRLNYHCSYNIDGYYRTMDFYYDIIVNTNAILVTNVSMSSETATLEVGESLQLNAIAYPTNASNRLLRWYSENPSVASVSNSGLVTAQRDGIVKIWAYATDGSGAGNFCTFTVQSTAKVSSIILSDYDKTLEVGEEFMITATVLPVNSANKNVTWMTTNASVATVSQGKIKAVGPGECNIMAWAADGSKVVRTCKITVLEGECYWLSVVIPNGSFFMDVTNLEKVRVKIEPEQGYEIHSVTLDGIDQGLDNKDGIFIFNRFESNSNLNVVFKSIKTMVDETISSSEDIQVSIKGNEVNISGAECKEVVFLYTTQGNLIRKTFEKKFLIPDPGVYIICIGTRSFKIAV